MTGLRTSHGVLAPGSLATLTLAHVGVGLAMPSPVVSSAGSPSTHPATGPVTTFIAAAAMVVLSFVALMRLWRIAKHAAARADFGRVPSSGHVARFAAAIGYRWRRLFVSVLALYVFVETVEAGWTGESLLGPVTSLSTALVLAAPMIALASFFVAAISALADWCRCVLASRSLGALQPLGASGRLARPISGASAPLRSRILAAASWPS